MPRLPEDHDAVSLPPVPSAVIAAMAPDDEAEIVGLWRRCGLTRPWNDPHEDIAICRSSGHGEVMVARVGGRLAGAMMVGHDGHRGAIYYLGVDPAVRGAGLGRRLVAVAREWCRARGLPKLNILVRRDNAAVLGFYERLGWHDTDSVSLSCVLDAGRAEDERRARADWARARVDAEADRSTGG